jgi:hypothetical protein
MVEFSGIEFRHVDNRVMSLMLVQLGLSRAAMFAADGTVLQPSEVLYKKAILVERGSFRPVTKVNIDMLESTKTQFEKEPEMEGESIVELMEITMRNLTSSGELDLKDFLARAELLAAAGKTVLISDYFEYYRLSGYFSQYTNKPIGIIMGAMSLHQLFADHYYTALEGGILEAFGRLFKNNTRLYIYPFLDPETQILYKVENFNITQTQKELYAYLVTSGLIRQLNQYDESILSIFSRDVLKRIKDNDVSWEQMVPPEICSTIIKRRFFGYHGPPLKDSNES